MEDILEEIVGEIGDESDEDERLYTKVNNNTYVFEAKVLLNDFSKILDIPDDTFADVKGESETRRHRTARNMVQARLHTTKWY